MLNINDYRYELPPEKIAPFPLSRRDASKLLVYNKGTITHSLFKNIAGFLPDNAFLFFNDTKVIPARMHFRKDTGAAVEIFLLSPHPPSTLLSQAMGATDQCAWKCTIGNLKRWPPRTSLQRQIDGGVLKATLEDKEESVVRFTWESGVSFAAIVEMAGETPLPPYLRREAVSEDRTRYQTIYSHFEGAVAAPTAGLHFTDDTFGDLRRKNIGYDFLTLHVSAGTFQPVKSVNADEHVMHGEQVVVSKKNIRNLMEQRFIIPVGTTSMRTLESLYWFGARLLNEGDTPFDVDQNAPYELRDALPSVPEAMSAILRYMERQQEDFLIGRTSIFIRPGYEFRICRGLITNFHQPASTLVLLVAAFVGADWRKIYDDALSRDYRFLSYGDSSLLIP